MSDFTYHSFSKNELEHSEIIALFKQTFTDSEGEAEGEMLQTLVTNLLNTTASEELKIFAAKEADKLVACVFFTPLRFATGEVAYLLSPMATLTAYQGKGIGQGLINFGLQALKAQGVGLAFTYGDPNFYSKVGFEQVTEAQFKAPHPLSFPHGWLAQSLAVDALTAIDAESSCVQGLDDPSVW